MKRGRCRCGRWRLRGGRKAQETVITSTLVVGCRLKSMMDAKIQYVSDESGQPTAVIVPLSLWREIESERETAYLLKSKKMKDRLLEAKEREQGISLEATLAKLGI